MLKGHIHRILWEKVDKNSDYLEVGFVIKDLDKEEKTYKIKGKIRIEPYPSINDYIIAHKTDKIYSNDIYICSLIRVELPIKKELIFDKIMRLSDKSLTKKEATFLIENNKDIWERIYDKELEVGKIKDKKIDKIYNNFENEKLQKDDKEKLKDYLFKYEIILKNNQIDNLIKKYKNSYEIIEIMNSDLIQLSSVDGISITTLINISDKLNHTEDEKLKLIIMYSLMNSSNGDTCITYNKLITNILKEKGVKFSKSLNKEQIDKNIDELIDNENIIRYKEYLYESKIFECENKIGFFLKSKNNKNAYLKYFLTNAENFLEDYEGNELNNEQRESFLSIFKSNVNITIGPAGTGKSEILTRLCEYVKNHDEISILFLTPTGKACDRLTNGFKKRNLDEKSYTIHKFIYYNYEKCNEYENEYKSKNEIIDFDTIKDNNYKIIVIDEMSMVSLKIFNRFIENIKGFKNCVLLILGDINQLPSIDCGDVLNNLFLSKSFNLVELKEIFRSESKGLLVAQNNILDFKSLLENMPESDNSFKWIKEDPKNTDIFIKVLDDFKELPLIITSTNKVVNEYQNIIKNKYNIDYKNKKSTIINNITFHEDDYIMIKKNDYDNGLTNGMIGKIISIRISISSKKEKSILKILFDGEKEDKVIDSEILENMNLGYIMTIHKSQGSESENVIILLDESSKINTMNLLYTAITRSKKKCILISEGSTIETIINEKRKTKRISNLKDFC